MESKKTKVKSNAPWRRFSLTPLTETEVWGYPAHVIFWNIWGAFYLKVIACKTRRFDEVVGGSAKTAERRFKERVETTRSKYKRKGIKWNLGNVSGKRHTCNFCWTENTKRVGQKSKGHKASGLGASITGSKHNLYVGKISSTDPNFEEKIEYRSVLPDCFDFINEKTCLMFLGVKLGIEVDWLMKSIQSW